MHKAPPPRFRLLWLVLLCVCFTVCVAAEKTEKDRVKHTVSIKSLQYKPAKLTIKAGEIVSWTNDDDRDHTVVAEDGSFKSPNIKAGHTYNHTFDKTGRFKYGCTYHPRMKGEIIVEKK